MQHEIKLGKLIIKEEYRDAVHVAIAPVKAAEKLHRGQRVALVEGTLDRVCSQGKKIGVVDPFLNQSIVEKNDEFFVCLFPSTVTDMRHEWTHPAFSATDARPTPEEAQKMVAERSLRAFANELGENYEDLLFHAKDYIKQGYYWCEGGHFEGVSMPPDFWDNYEIVTGEKVDENNRGHFFTCYCN